MTTFRFSLRSRTGPLSIADYRELACKAVPNMVWAYVDGGADDLWTLRANRSAFDRWRLRQRVLTGVESPDLSAELAGVRLSLPVLLAPTGLSGLSHWSGEIAGALAAERRGTRAVISTAASYSPEEVAGAAAHSHFFQLYPWADLASGARALTQSFIERAHSEGYAALFVTVDSGTLGNREGERRHGMGAPPTLTPMRLVNAASKPRWSVNLLRHRRVPARLLAEGQGLAAGVRSARAQYKLMRPDLDWDDFSWMRQSWDRPLFIKGILDPDDAERAVDLGADGVVVSNHGGRQLDGVPAAIDALAPVVDRVGARVPVLMDGGIRRGTDVIKALCLGASVVLIGRPWLYGLAARGQSGVEHVLEILDEEMRRAMILMGVSSVTQLDRSHLIAGPVPATGP